MYGFIWIPLLAALSGHPEIPPAPPVEELVATALARSPALAAARSRSAAAREIEPAASALANPTVEAMVQDAGFPDYTIGSEDMSMAGVEVRQPLPYPGKRRARAASARAATDLRAAEAAELERRITAEVRRLFARIYAVDKELEVHLAAHDLVDLMAATARSRYATGGGDQEALLKAQLQVTRLEERLDDLETERLTLVAELNRWLDRPGESRLGAIATLPAAPEPPGPCEERAVSASSQVRLARAAVAAAERRAEVEKLDREPDLSPAAGIATRGPKGPVLTLRLGVELPFWRRQRQEPKIRAAEQELEAARHELRDAEAQARAEAARLEAEWVKAERQITRFREGLVPQTSLAFDAARSSYLAGRGSFSTLTEDFMLWLDARVQLARREADRFALWAELEKLTGGAP
ncbi:MAG TPA: TolC family protein [Thermoanaerobaculia bacterium]|nr:TolC family protein [Thermoanaerobaculia bacterium]